MRILFLGYNKSQSTLIDFLEKRGHDISWTDSREILTDGYDLIISFGYRHIIPKNTLDSLNRPIINLHISYLPYNKGAHPNFWSHYEGTQSGVSIHEIDDGIDTGRIIYRDKVELDESLTLKKSYDILFKRIQTLFKENIEELEKFSYKPIPNKIKGTYHKKIDLPEWVEWDLTIKEVKKYGK